MAAEESGWLDMHLPTAQVRAITAARTAFASRAISYGNCSFSFDAFTQKTKKKF
jgi:hypothetical protein